MVSPKKSMRIFIQIDIFGLNKLYQTISRYRLKYIYYGYVFEDEYDTYKRIDSR